ncbi:MAG: sugar phosphate isomerase/epimerase [Planctomycetales bacterium]|nr:sugar phosphate isomerase/epimerase [Planctomycetales bacterium]
MPSLSRRKLLTTTGLALAGMSVHASVRLRTAHGIEPVRQPGEGQLKLALAGYSLRSYLTLRPGTERSLDLFGFVDYCASLGLDGAELTQYYFPPETTQDYVLRLKRHAHLAGVDITGGAIRDNVTVAAGADRDKELDHIQQWVEHYADLGAPVIRVFAGRPASDVAPELAVERAAEALQLASDRAGERGVMLAIENHDFTTNIDYLMQIVQRVDSPWFGVNFDSGNFSESSDPYGDMARIAPYAVNAQMKARINSQNGSQAADFPRIVGILREAGYRGYLTFEYEEKPDPYEEIPKYLDQLRAALRSPTS